MGCGCSGRAKDYASKNEYFTKLRDIAKKMADEDGKCYLVIKKSDGAYGCIPKTGFKIEGGMEIIERFLPE